MCTLKSCLYLSHVILFTRLLLSSNESHTKFVYLVYSHSHLATIEKHLMQEEIERRKSVSFAEALELLSTLPPRPYQIGVGGGMIKTKSTSSQF